MTEELYVALVRQALPRPARAHARRGDAAGPPPPAAREPNGTPASRPRRCCPALTGTLADLGIDLAAQRERGARRRGAAEQEPARVLLADRGARPGRPRDPADGRPGRLARALPRGRAHRALRAHVGRPPAGGAPPRRQRGHRGLGRAPRAARGRPRLARAPPRLRPAARVRAPRTPPSASTPCAATPRSSSTSSSCTQSPDPAGHGRPLRRSCSATRPRSHPSPADYLADVDAGFYASCYVRSWAFEAQIQLFLRERVRHRVVLAPRGRSLLRELWHEGQRLTADEMLRDVTGSALDLESIVERAKEPLRA